MPRAQRIVALAVGGVVGIALEPACEPGSNLPTVAFRCDPQAMPEADRCPKLHTCCSDDPTTPSGALPMFLPNPLGAGETPLFAAANNDVGRSGMCVRTEDVTSSGLELPLGCPVPCNPTWSEGDATRVCGAGRQCCQTVELDADDCVRDEATGLWRPADGRDALASLDGGTRWNPTANSTHQDPGFDVCATHAGARTGDVFRTCVAQLTTANQRGYCMHLGAGQECPGDPDAGYRSVCDEMND